MNLDQFAASFHPATGEAPSETHDTAASDATVVFAATIVSATKEFCVLEVNGALYELAGDQVIDIQILVPGSGDEAVETKADDDAAPPPHDDSQAEASAQHETKGKAARRDAKPAEPVAEERAKEPEDIGPQLAFLKVKADAVLTQRVDVPVGLIAAAGTWVTLVPSVA